MTTSKQLRLLPECRDQREAALHRAQITARTLAQVGEVASTVVRHGVMREVAPDVFDGVQFRAVSLHRPRDMFPDAPCVGNFRP
jgi:hypothetical protein